MKRLNDYRIRLMLVGIVAAIVISGGNAYSDFTISAPIQLGPPIYKGHDPQGCCYSRDGLELYFSSRNRPDGYGDWDIWVATRETIDAPWGEPVNLGPNVNSTEGEVAPSISHDGLELYFTLYHDYKIRVCSRPSKDAPWSNPEILGPPVGVHLVQYPEVSADGLELYFESNRPGGYGLFDIWVSSRATTSDPWSEPINLGPNVNSASVDGCPSISSDGLALFFCSGRPGTYGDIDIWVTTRSTTDAEWGPPVNYPNLNVFNRLPESSPAIQNFEPAISPDGSVLYFDTPHVLWQSSIIPIVDLNGDRIVDAADMVIMVDHWGTDNSLCDIGPMPWGDGIVDVQDLIVLAEHLFEDTRLLVAHWPLDESEGMFAHESVSGNNDFVMGDPVWQPTGGKVDGALELDGVDDCIITSASLNPADGPFSVFAWIKGGMSGQTVLSQMGGANWLGTDASEGNLMTELKGTGQSASAMLSQTVIIDGDWHQIGFVWNGSHRTLYVDDAAVTEDKQNNLAYSNNNLYIGTGKGMEPGTFWSGLIDDVRIYNRVVSP